MKSLIVWLKLNFAERLYNSLNAAVTQSENRDLYLCKQMKQEKKVSLNYMSIWTSVPKMQIKSI